MICKMGRGDTILPQNNVEVENSGQTCPTAQCADGKYTLAHKTRARQPEQMFQSIACHYPVQNL